MADPRTNYHLRQHFNQNTEQRQFVSPGLEDAFRHKYPAGFSAADMYVMITFPGNQTRQLGNLAALSISTHRDTFPVSSMPYVSPRGFTQGHRTVAGTMIFHTIDRGALSYRLKPQHQHADELPLVDVLITYANELGMLSYEQLRGIRLLDFGKSMSLENLHPVESYSYMALDYLPMRPVIDDKRAHPNFLLNRSQNRDLKALRVLDGGSVGSMASATVAEKVAQSYIGLDLNTVLQDMLDDK